MLAESSQLKFEIGHVLFIDIVGYSKLLINQQSDQLETLKSIVRGSEQCKKAEAEGKLLRLPTGDGGALVFRTTPEAPVLCAMEIGKELKKHPELPVRMGIHSGPVNEISDLNEQANIAGAGINIAQRVMDCGDAGHILLSKRVADDLEQYPQWRSQLQDLGECEVKHGMRVSIVNLHADEVGNPQLPKKLQALKKHRTRMRWAAATAALLALAAIIAGIAMFSRNRGRSTFSAPEKSIAVLPFENLSSDKENAFFTDGVQGEILTDLAKVADLKVISQTSVMQYKSTAKRNLREIANALGVAHLLEGSVQRAGNRVRVNAQLIDARSDTHMWADTYDRDLADVFAIQSEIAQKIANQLQAKLSPKEEAVMHAKPTSDLAAYDLYLRALEIERSRVTSTGSGGAEESKREIGLLEDAVNRDPSFVSALCLLARVQVYLYWENATEMTTHLDLANKALAAAARLQPDAGEVHLTRAIIYYWGARDYAPALAELALAKRSLPNDIDVLFFTAAIERRQGNWDESTRHIEQALALDPRNIQLVSELAGSNYFGLRRYADAARTLDDALAWKPFDFGLGFLRAYIDMVWKADLDRWKEVVSGEAAGNADPNDLITARLNLALMERDYHTAEQILASPGGNEFDDDAFFTPREWNQAIVARGLGDSGKAQAALQAARERAAGEVRKRPENAKALMVLGQIDAGLGRNEDAIREGQRAVELLPVTKDAMNGSQLLIRLASIYAQVGETDRAFDLLEKGIHQPDVPNYGSLKLEEVWDPLRKDPRFQKLVTSLAPKNTSNP
jgi:TolB-like protein/class 3 adenylate cyclase/Flp pilus assembly protein TadD